MEARLYSEPLTQAKRTMKDLSESRVLIVDDDRSSVDILVSALRKDYKLSVAVNGPTALGNIRMSPPDLVLLDIVMPGVNGWQVLEMINKKADKKEIPVFFVSAQDLTADQPKISPFMMATFGEGLSVIKLLHCSLEFSRLMLRSD